VRLRRKLTRKTVASVVPSTAESPRDPKKLAFEVVERNAEAIATVGDVLYYFGEPGMQEYESSKYLKATLEQIGFKVKVGGAALPTNVWATWGSGKPVIAIATEMDALSEGSQTPGSIPRKPLVEGAPGRMKGHNVMAGMVVGAAHAVKKTMEQFKLPGITHIQDGLSTGYGLGNYALIGAKFTFKGRTAHGGVNPWDGKDAVDAVVLMDIGFDKLREHLRPTYRGHRAITNGGVQPNIISRRGSDLVVHPRRHRTVGQGKFRQAGQHRAGRGIDDRHHDGNGALRRGVAFARQ